MYEDKVPMFYCLYFLLIEIIDNGSPHTKSDQFINRKHVDQPSSSSSVPTTSAAIQQPRNREFYSQGVYKLLKIIDVNNNIIISNFANFLYNTK